LSFKANHFAGIIIAFSVSTCTVNPQHSEGFSALRKHTAAKETACLEKHAVLQHTLQDDSTALQAQFTTLHQTSEWRERGYFSASEHDAIEGLLFRFMVNRGGFWGQLDAYGQSPTDPESKGGRSECHILALHAGFALADSSAFLVAEFHKDPIAKDKLNEAFYRSEIEPGTYERLYLSLESGPKNAALERAWVLYNQRKNSAENEPVEAVEGGPVFAPLLAEIPHLRDSVRKNTSIVFSPDTGYPAQLKQTIDSSEAMNAARNSEMEINRLAYQIRALVFKDVSRIKSPTVYLIKFSPQQVQQIHNLLQPGDILLSYTAGYVSDVFIPGNGRVIKPANDIPCPYVACFARV